MNAKQAQQAENRNTWTSEAGPIQTKRVEKALGKFRQASIGHIELWGVRGEDEHRSHIVELGLGSGGSPMVPASVEKLQTIGEAYGWTITSKNHKDIIGELEEAAKGVELPIVDKLRSPEDNAKQKAEQAERDAARKIEQDACNRAWGKIIAKAPANAAAVIIAELIEDQSDIMTDYFSSTSTRRVVIGFRIGKREDFKQLRRAAATFEHTQHLGPGCDKYRVCITDANGGHLPSWQWDGDSTYTTEAACQAAIDAVSTTEGKFSGCSFSIHCESVEHRENYSMGAGNYLKAGGRHCNGWQVRAVALGTSSHYKYEDQAPDASKQTTTPTPGSNMPALEGAGYSIQTHYHTKRDIDFYLVVTDERVSREEYETLRDSCKAAGGWYSRKWSTTPGGYAFTEKADAAAWAVSEFGGSESDPNGDGSLCEGHEPPSGCKEGKQLTPINGQARAFYALADRLHKDTNIGERAENTPKQRRQAAYARFEASNAQHAETAARAIAEAIQDGTLPRSLKYCPSKGGGCLVPCTLARIKELTRRARDTSIEGYYDVIPTDRLSSVEPLAQTLRDWIDGLGKDSGPTVEEMKAESEWASVLHKKIPGFFPTPTEAAERMVEAAGLSIGDCVLEPSAGRGDLADAVEEAIGPSGVLHCIEVNQRLAALHRSETRPVHCLDFTELDPREWDQCDAVIMNPPFEKGQDRTHVLHAWEFLKPGGRLVAICSPGSLMNSKGKHMSEFRQWFGDNNVEILDKEVDGFAATNIRAVMIRAIKP